MRPIAVSPYVLLLARAVIAAPSLSFPVNAQVPPIARVSQSFEFQFAANTFTSTQGGGISYAIQGAPAWLVIQSSSRTLAGTPQAQDEGSFSFQLIATDLSGSAMAPVTLVVESGPAPSLQANITAVLSDSSSGALSGLSSLTLLPQSTFGISFPQDTFSGSDNLSYYATLADRSPLPSWINFNSDSLTISGVTPTSSQNVPLLLLVSSISGFSDGSLSFSIIVSDHTLAFSSVNQSVMVQPNQPFPNTSLQSQLLSNGQPVQAQIVASASVAGPSWLTIDPKTLTLSGNVPADVSTADAHVQATDIYGNNANAYIHIVSPLGVRSPPTASSTTATTASTVGSSSAASAVSASPTTTSQSSTSSTSTQSSSQGWIAAAVVVPTAIAIAVVVLLWFYCRRRDLRRQRQQEDAQRRFNEKSTPIDVERQAGGPGPRVSEVSLGSHDQLVLDSQRFSLAGGNSAYYHGQNSPRSSRRRSTLTSNGNARQGRTSRQSFRNGSAPDTRRLTGLGHGRLPSLSSPLHADTMLRVGARRRCTQCGSCDVETLASSTPSTVQRRSRPLSDSLRPSIRMLPRDDLRKDSPSSKQLIQELLREVGEIDNRPFDEKRSSYLKKSRGRRPDRDKRTHDEQMYDLQTSYDRLKRELGGGSLRRKSVPRALLPPPSIWSMDGQRLGSVEEVTAAGAEGDEAMVPPLTTSTTGSERLSFHDSPARWIRGKPQKGSQESSEWVDTEPGSSEARSPVSSRRTGRGSGSREMRRGHGRDASKLDDWEDMLEEGDEEYGDDESAVLGQAEAVGIGIATTTDVAYEGRRPRREDEDVEAVFI